MKLLLFWLFLWTFATPANPAAAVIESVAEGIGNIGKKTVPKVGKEVVESVAEVGGNSASKGSNIMGQITGLTAQTKKEATRLEVQAFMLSAVKNPVETTPLVKQLAKGAMETALDNPKLLAKAVTRQAIPKNIKKTTAKVDKLFSSLKSLGFKVSKMREEVIKKDTTDAVIITFEWLRQTIANGISKIEKDIQVINMAILIQANDLFLKFGAHLPQSLEAFHDLGSNQMMNFLQNSKKSGNPDLEMKEFFKKLKKDNPKEIKMLNKAKRDGAMEVVQERLVKSKKEFLVTVQQFSVRKIRKREIMNSNHLDSDEIDELIKDILNQFDALESALLKNDQ